MDRKQLKSLLSSGTSRILDVRKLHFEQGLAPLFQSSVLNGAILIKQAPSEDMRIRAGLPQMVTLIFIPYNRAKPEEGGESFFYTPENLRLTLSQSARGNTAEAVAADGNLLTALDRIPAFNPWLVLDVLRRANIAIPNGYCEVGEREAALIQQRMRARLRPLVAMAFTGKNIDGTTIERLVHMLWELKNLSEIEPLITAFRVDMKDAPEVFFCWLGLAFFENEYLKLQLRLKGMTAWMASQARPKGALPRDVLEHHMHMVDLVRKRLQITWKTALTILQSYTSTYEELIKPGGDVARFIEFLQQSHTHFWTLGCCLGRLEQSLEIWEELCALHKGAAFTYNASTELFVQLAQITAANGEAVQTARPKADA